MPVLFITLAQACAPAIAPATLAAIVGVESGMAPLAIRVNSNYPFKDQPVTKAEAIETATTLIAQGQGLDLGLGGISAASLSHLGLSISDVFDPCLNLNATARLLEEYKARAVNSGNSSADAHAAMLQSYYGQGDASIGKMVGYDRRIQIMEQRLLPGINALTLAGVADSVLPSREAASDHATPPVLIEEVGPKDPSAKAGPDLSTDEAPAWDVFNTRAASTTLVFSQQLQE